MRSLLSCLTPALVAPSIVFISKIIIGVGLFTFKDHKNFVLNIWLRIGNRCVRNAEHFRQVGFSGFGSSVPSRKWEIDPYFSIFGLRDSSHRAFFATTTMASYEALPGSPLVCILLCSSLPLSYACLATLRVDFFKVLRIQQPHLRNGYFRSLTCSVCVAEVTQVNSIAVSPIHAPGFPGA